MSSRFPKKRRKRAFNKPKKIANKESRELAFERGHDTPSCFDQATPLYKFVESDTLSGTPQEHSYFHTTIPCRDPTQTSSTVSYSRTECVLFGKDVQRAIPSNVIDIPKPPSIRHRISTSSHRGLGMFATCDLDLGDLVCSERPLLISPYKIVTSCVIMKSDGDPPSDAQIATAAFAEYEIELGLALNRMDARNRTAYLALADSHTKDGSGRLFGILRTNAYSVDLGDRSKAESKHAAVFDQLSRINHSCAPNARVNFCIHSFSLQVYALGRIEKEEEIFISYCNSSLPHATRQAKLSPHGFHCICPACTNPSHDALLRCILREASTLPKYHPMSLFYQYPNTNAKPDFSELLKRSTERIQTMEDLKLQCLDAFDQQLMAAATAAKELNKMESAIEFLHKRVLLARASRGRRIELPTDVDFSRTRAIEFLDDG